MNTDKLKELAKEYGLVKEDFFKHKHYIIITRQGIDKIQAKADIRITYDLTYYPEAKTFVAHATAGTGDNIIETFGEASPSNTNNAYPVAMAEKRAMSRAVLKLSGFYELGVYSEDEADDFKKA